MGGRGSERAHEKLTGVRWSVLVSCRSCYNSKHLSAALNVVRAWDVQPAMGQQYRSLPQDDLRRRQPFRVSAGGSSWLAGLWLE